MDGRLRDGALAALFGCIVYALGAMSRVAVPGIVSGTIMQEYGFSQNAISLLVTAAVAGQIAFIGVGGLLVDRYGWKRLLLVGTLIQAFGYVPVHESRSLTWMMAGEFLNGGGRTIVYLAILKLVDRTFPHRYFAALIGVFYVFSYGGNLCASSVYPWLVDVCGSWQRATFAINCGTLVGGAAVALTLCGRRAGAPCEVPAGGGDGDVRGRQVFPWRDIAAFRKPSAWMALAVAGFGIAIYWAFITRVAGPFVRSGFFGTDRLDLVSEMSAIVMCEMVLLGTVSLLLHNARRPFFLMGAGSLLAGFALFTVLWFTGSRDAGLWRYGFWLVGIGYGTTGVLLSGVKERVPAAFAASAIGFTNFMANAIIIAVNQASGVAMSVSSDAAYGKIFVTFLALAATSFAFAVHVSVSGVRWADVARQFPFRRFHVQ